MAKKSRKIDRLLERLVSSGQLHVSEAILIMIAVEQFQITVQNKMDYGTQIESARNLLLQETEV